MSQGTTFRIFAKDLRMCGLLAPDVVRNMAVDDAMRESLFRFVTREEAEKNIVDGKIPRYLPIYQPKQEGDIGGNFIRDPFANWVDTNDNHVCREIASYDFTSDFNELHEHYGLNAYSWNDSVEITRDEAEKILAVVDYILAGEYSRKVESAVFRNNPFFGVFEEQFVSFADRFRKPKAGKQEEDDEYDEELDMDGIRKDDAHCCRRLRDIVAGFLQTLDSMEYTTDSKYFSYHLAYFKW